MAGAIRKRARAERDLIEHYIYLAEEAGTTTADRFLRNVEKSLEELRLQPRIGAPLALRRQELAGLRKWPVSGFENFLIFYVPQTDGISVVRVLHAARDWWGVLGIG
jgi:toxin ParE1/3/4